MYICVTFVRWKPLLERLLAVSKHICFTCLKKQCLKWDWYDHSYRLNLCPSAHTNILHIAIVASASWCFHVFIFSHINKSYTRNKVESLNWKFRSSLLNLLYIHTFINTEPQWMQQSFKQYFIRIKNYVWVV